MENRTFFIFSNSGDCKSSLPADTLSKIADRKHASGVMYFVYNCEIVILDIDTAFGML